MKYDSDIPFAHGLPNAPMPMPKQRLERPRVLISALRSVFLVWHWF